MTVDTQPKGPWINRFATRFFAVVLAVLIYWLLGFLVEDIEDIRGPDYAKIEEKHVDKSLIGRQRELASQIKDLDRQVKNVAEEQSIVGDSSRNLQTTIHQLLELQRLISSYSSCCLSWHGSSSISFARWRFPRRSGWRNNKNRHKNHEHRPGDPSSLATSSHLR